MLVLVAETALKEVKNGEGMGGAWAAVMGTYIYIYILCIIIHTCIYIYIYDREPNICNEQAYLILERNKNK